MLGVRLPAAGLVLDPHRKDAAVPVHVGGVQAGQLGRKRPRPYARPHEAGHVGQGQLDAVGVQARYHVEAAAGQGAADPLVHFVAGQQRVHQV